MQIIIDRRLDEFEFGYHADNTLEYLTYEDLNTIDEYLKKQYPHGMHEDELYKFFEKKYDTIAELLGYEDFEELIDKRDCNGSNLIYFPYRDFEEIDTLEE